VADATPSRRSQHVIIVVVTVLLAVAAGVLLERRIGSREAQRVRTAIVRTMLWGLMPFVSYVSIARLHLTANVGIGIVVAAGALVTTTALMWLAARGPLGLDRPSTGALMVCAVQVNTGFFGLPLCAALSSQAEFSQAVAYDVLVSMPAFVFGSFTIGALFGTHGEDKQMGRHILTTLLKNPVLFAAVAGLLVPESWAPHVLELPVRLAVYATVPLGFMAVGITLADEAEDGAFRIPPPLTRPLAVLAGLRMLVMPAIVLAISLFVVKLPATYPLLAAMPSGVNTILVAHQTGLNLRMAAGGTAWTTTIALVGVTAVAVAQAVGLL
jgi:predicted permease